MSSDRQSSKARDNIDETLTATDRTDQLYRPALLWSLFINLSVVFCGIDDPTPFSADLSASHPSIELMED